MSKQYTQTQLAGIVSELNSGKLYVTCGIHNYVGGSKPPQTRGCSKCWMAYYVWDLATTPPHLRKERLDELEGVVLRAVEFERTGKFGKDFELYEPGDPRFKVE